MCSDISNAIKSIYKRKYEYEHYANHDQQVLYVTDE